MGDTSPGESASLTRKSDELRLFIFLAVFLFPILAVIVVGGYGFVIWMSHLFLGPPGPPV